MAISILNEQLFASLEASSRDINSAEMLPPVCYTVIGARHRHVDTLAQRGRRSRDAIRGRHSWQEQTHREFNNWLVDYRAAWHGQGHMRAAAE